MITEICLESNLKAVSMIDLENIEIKHLEIKDFDPEIALFGALDKILYLNLGFDVKIVS